MPDLTQHGAVADALGDLGIPIVLDVECGHVAPYLPLVNGALARVVVDGDRREITQTLAWTRVAGDADPVRPSACVLRPVADGDAGRALRDAQRRRQRAALLGRAALDRPGAGRRGFVAPVAGAGGGRRRRAAGARALIGRRVPRLVQLRAAGAPTTAARALGYCLDEPRWGPATRRRPRSAVLRWAFARRSTSTGRQAEADTRNARRGARARGARLRARGDAPRGLRRRAVRRAARRRLPLRGLGSATTWSTRAQPGPTGSRSPMPMADGARRTAVAGPRERRADGQQRTALSALTVDRDCQSSGTRSAGPGPSGVGPSPADRAGARGTRFARSPRTSPRRARSW